MSRYAPGYVSPNKGRKRSPEAVAAALAGRTIRPIEDRFWEKVEKTDTCWLWTGARMPIGYGRFGIKKENCLAHVVSMGLAGVEIPPGMVLDHICKVRNCVRPEHLRVVTRSWNAKYNNDSIFSRNRARTHCTHGHEFTEANIRRTEEGYRNCRPCSVMHAKAEQRAKKLGMPPRPEWLAKKGKS
jgi:hypothetical protein